MTINDIKNITVKSAKNIWFGEVSVSLCAMIQKTMGMNIINHGYFGYHNHNYPKCISPHVYSATSASL